MLPQLTSSSYSYWLNYKIHSPMFDWFDKKTEQTKWVRFPATCAFIASTAVNTATRIMGLAESFFLGWAILFSAPFTEKKMENAILGFHKISVQTGKKILGVVYISVEVFVDGIFGVLLNPKYYIMSMSESMKVNLAHAKKGTIGSVEHSMDICEADGVAYERLLRYQGKIIV